MNPTLQRVARSTPVHVAFAVVAMGGWALFANSAHGLAAAWAAAAAQGSMSGLITLVLKRTLEEMVRRLAGPGAWVIPPVVTATAILGLLTGVHALIGTPEVLRTVAAPWSVSTLYAIVYSAALARLKSRAP